jgi:AbrB family looped-hinge helix DNA binding protein
MLTEHVKVGPDGRIVLPAPFRHSHGIKSGDTVVVESDGDSLLVRTHEALLRETQLYFAQFPSDGESIVDALIADRRAEARREEERHIARARPVPRDQ